MLPFFKSRQPAHRALSVQRQVRATQHYAGDDPWQEGLARCMKGDLDVPKELAHAFGIYKTPEKQERIEALLLAGATPADVLECLELDAGVTKLYRHLFFDTSVFETRLDRIEYAESYPNAILNGRARAWKLDAVEEGLEFLKATFGGGNYNVSPQKMIQTAVNKSFLLLGRSRHYDVGGPENKEIRQWALTGVKGISQLPTAVDMSGQDNTGDILFELDRRKQIASEQLAPKKHVDPTQILTGTDEEKPDAQ